MKFLNHRVCLFLSLVDNEYFLEKQQKYDEFDEYFIFQDFINELYNKDRFIEFERNSILSNKEIKD